MTNIIDFPKPKVDSPSDCFDYINDKIADPSILELIIEEIKPLLAELVIPPPIDFSSADEIIGYIHDLRMEIVAHRVNILVCAAQLTEQ